MKEENYYSDGELPGERQAPPRVNSNTPVPHSKMIPARIPYGPRCTSHAPLDLFPSYPYASHGTAVHWRARTDQG